MRLPQLCVTAIVLGLVAMATAPSPAAAARGKLAVVYGIGAQHTLYASGTVQRPAKRGRALLESRSRGRTHVRARARLKGRRLALRWRYPRRARSVQVRVRIVAPRNKRRAKTIATGSWRTLRTAGAPKPPPVAKVRPQAITAAPASGQAGAVRISGATSVKAGDVLALGVSPHTPDGLLAKVTAISQDGGETVAQTEPVTLPDVLPSGAMDIDVPTTKLDLAGAGGRARAALGSQLSKAFSCTNGVEMQAGAEASLSAGVAIQAGWDWGLPPRVNARFSGTVRASAKVSASVTAEASCALEPTPLFARPISLGTYQFTVGPVPVVVRPQAQLYLSASGDVRAGVATSAMASVTAEAGVDYRDGRFKPFGSLAPTLDFTPPTLTQSASVQAAIAPTLDVLVYGVAGPRIDLKAGLKLVADPSATPWWRLTAPMSLGAQLRLDVWKLEVSSPRYTIWSREPELAVAAGPSPAASAGGLSGPTTRARITWDTTADVDLHAWDESGRHTYFHDLQAIPGARLVRDIIPGYGPEEFIEETNLGRRYTLGLCVYNGDGATVTMDVTDPDGSARRFSRTLVGRKSAALITTSPLGGGFIPSPGWCADGDDDPTTLDVTR